MGLDRINPVALITGAASGVGAACARDIAMRSDGGLILVDRDEAALDRLADLLGEQGAAPERVSILAFDVCDLQQWERASAFIKDQYGRLDWALASADPSSAASNADNGLVDWPRVNLDGAVLTLRAAMPLMKLNSQGGAIVVAASAAALKAESGPNAAAKGMLQLLRIVAKEGAPDNIRVNAVTLGAAGASIATLAPSFQDLARQAGGEHAAFHKIAQLATPLARYAGADDIARLVLMLLADETAVSGVTLVAEPSNRLS